MSDSAMVLPMLEGQQEQKQKALQVFSLRDLQDTPEETHSWVVEDLLPTGGSAILHGKPKQGKSTLARQLAFCVATGQPFLGRQVLQGSVLYIALEEKKSEVWNHFQLLGSDGTEPISTVFDYRGNRLSEIRDYILAFKPVLVIVDTLAKFVDLKKINEYGKVNESLRHIHDLARDTGAHILCLHHSRKGASDDSIDNLLGSTALSGAVDTIIALQGQQGKRTISTLQRYGVAMEETVVDFNAETRTLSLLGTTKDIAHQSKRSTLLVLSESIVEFVASNPGCTESEIVVGVTGKREAKVTQLRELLKDRLRREGAGKSGEPFRYYADVPIEVENTY